ncbi:COFA1 protein, partial [Acromyrmex charruanus]
MKPQETTMINDERNIIVFRSLLVISAALCAMCSRADFFSGKGEFHEKLLTFMFSEVVYDLMEASVSSMTDDNNLYMDDGVDGFPAFGFRPGSEVKQPYRLYLPEKLPAEFTLVATFKPTSFRTSYLFAVLNPFETVVQLGIRISDGPGSNQNVSLVYTNSDEHSHSEEVAKFTVPKLTKKWSKIVIKVSTSDVILYLNCHEMARQKVTRIPQELVFDTASTLYIAQAGPHIQERYDVSIVHHLSTIVFRKMKKVDAASVRAWRNETKRVALVGMFSTEIDIVSLCSRVRVTK